MSDEQEQVAPAKRGEAKWKARKEEIAARNDRARKAGKQQRQAADDLAAAKRRAFDRRERDGLS